MAGEADNVSHALIEQQRIKQQSARVEKMYAALLTWRAELTTAMALRATEIEPSEDDAEMNALTNEFRHWLFVSAAMNVNPNELMTLHPLWQSKVLP